MDALGPILDSTYRAFGLAGLLAVLVMAMVGAMAGVGIAQYLSLRKFEHGLTSVFSQQLAAIDHMRVIISNQDRSHTDCERHWQTGHEQVQTMQGMMFELRELTRTIHEFHLETTKELVRIFSRFREAQSTE